MARKVVEDTEHDEQFPELQDGEMLAITSKDLQQDYAFHRLGKTVKTWMVDQKHGCPDTQNREEGVGTEVSARARQITLAGETSVYSVKCRQREVQLATDWDTHTWGCSAESSVVGWQHSW